MSKPRTPVKLKSGALQQNARLTSDVVHQLIQGAHQEHELQGTQLSLQAVKLRCR